MTDKIMIDGVDVNKCAFLDDYSRSMCNGVRGDNSGFHQGFCIQNPNCYYKQFKRKEEECKKLKEQFDDVACCYKDYKQSSSELAKNLVFEVKRARKYKKALENIKQELEESIYCENQECGCDDAEECLECMKKLILQKCEVLYA